MAAGEFQKARRLARRARKEASAAHQSMARGVEPARRTRLLLVAILFRGLEDFGTFVTITSQAGWDQEPKRIVAAWHAMCNATERLDYAGEALLHPATAYVIAMCHRFETAVDAAVGVGYYMSPEILTSGSSCSICGLDYRACPHEAGMIYDGEFCRRRPENPRLRAVSIVRTAVDRRCRLWPWDREPKSNTFKALIATLFDVAAVDRP